MPAVLPISPEAMAVYRATALRRWEEKRHELARRRDRAWQTVALAARLLKEQFGATRVVAFGSVIHGYWFSETSDIDLAAWGLRADDYFVAVARLQDLSPEFKIDLVAAENCRPELREAFEREGAPL